MNRKITTADFLATHPVFSLGDAFKALLPRGGRSGTVERLKHYLATGRLKLATRGVYAVVPAGLPAAQFVPDPFLVAAAARPDGIFCQHSALELLGTSQSIRRNCTLYTGKLRKPLALDGRTTIRFLDDPKPMRNGDVRHFGTRKIERRGKLLETTGPERTLVEGFRRPDLAGGLEELLRSASAFPVLDLDLIQTVLERYDVANLWAAVGWFLEQFQTTFHASEEVLARMERHRPASPQYLDRRERGGALDRRWSLIVPHRVAAMAETA